jgi:hypothetical protein
MLPTLPGGTPPCRHHSPTSFSTMPSGDSVTGTVVAAREAVVPTGGMALEDELELLTLDQQLKDEMEKRLKEKEELWTNSTTTPPGHSRSSPTRRRFQEYEPEDNQPSPVLQGVVNCLRSISNQMLRMSGRSGKNGGWPWFDGTYKDYPAFWRKWSSCEKHDHQLIPQVELVQLFRENCMNKEIACYIGGEETMAEAWDSLDILRGDTVHPGPDAGNPSIS